MSGSTQEYIVENAMKNVGFLPLSPNLVNSSQFPVNTVATKNQQDLTKNQQGLTKNQQGLTKNQQAVVPNQILVNSSQILSEQAKQAKVDLEVLVATGKTKDFLGKQLTFQDLDNMSEKDLLKYHRIYQSTLAVRFNDTFSKIAIKTYSKIASWFLPINDEDKLYNDLRSDYIVTTELDKWTGWLYLKMGGLMAVASTSLITFGNCDPDPGMAFHDKAFNDKEQPIDHKKLTQINEQPGAPRTETSTIA